MKKITLPTNFNNKLSCSCFIHIDVAPKNYIRESLLQQTEIFISTKDGSHPPVKAKLVDLCRLPLHQISSIITWQSHGMIQEEFINHIISLGSISSTTPMAVYYYQKIAE